MAAISAERIVLKIGSALLVEEGKLRTQWLASLAEDVAKLQARGTQVVLVSSGSIALGRGVLGFEAGPLTLETAQAAASVGQIQLAQAYQDALNAHDITAAQVLLTLQDTQDRRRYLNARATLNTLLGMGCVPIVNENDTIATDEIRYGDNDRLAAQIAVTIGADTLVLFSDVDGLYTSNPILNSDAQHIDIVDKITPDIEGMAGEGTSDLSKGGMKTKLMAAKIATVGGCDMRIANGRVLNPLASLETGARSTLFKAESNPEHARKRWISAMKPQGKIHIDAGAAAALSRGSSLLPAGITKIEGDFERGAPVEILNAEGHHIGMGLTRYTSDEAVRIRGAQSDQIEGILGYPGRAALIHRDDFSA